MRTSICATTFGDLLVRACEQSPDGRALAMPGLRLSFSELLDRAVIRARSLRSLGIDQGDVVGILMPNDVAYLENLFGASMLGATVATINARYRAHELSYVLAHSGLKVLVTTDTIVDRVDFGALLQQAIPELGEADPSKPLSLGQVPQLRACVMLGSGETPSGFIGRDAFSDLASRTGIDEIDELGTRVRLRDPAILMYTSGTTAMPKGCLLSHEALVRTAIAQAGRFKMTETDAFWTPLPLFHTASILPLMNSMWARAAFLTEPSFDAGTALQLIEEDRATILYPTFPAIAQAMVDHPDFAGRDLSKVRIYNHVGPPSLQGRMQKAFGEARQVQSYGSTELSGVICVCDPQDSAEIRATTCGRPWPGMQLRIEDLETRAEAATDEAGEILARGFGMLTCYLGDPERTSEAIDGRGWFHTGDLGSIDAEGRLHYHGREKDMLKVGGENVSALEVESYLGTHPSIKLAQIVGLADDRLGEVVVAYVELIEGAELDEPEVLAFCKGQIASYKIPRHVRFVEEWPMSTTKIQKFVLRDRIREELG